MTWHTLSPVADQTWAPPLAHNGLCECRGPFDRHPFHADLRTWVSTTSNPPSEYVGKHRRNEV